MILTSAVAQGYLADFASRAHCSLFSPAFVGCTRPSIFRDGSFKGYQQFLGKAGAARNMAAWYYSGNYREILEYVNDEVQDFLKMYFILKMGLPKMVTI